MKIAIYMPNWIGDAVMATPAIRAIRSHYPDASLIAITRPPIGDVLAGTDLVDRVLLHQPKSDYSEDKGWRFISRLREEEFDSAILFPNSLRSAWLAWISGAKQRVGFSRDGRGLLLTDKLIPHSRINPNPEIDEYLRIAAHLGCENLSHQMELGILSEDTLQLERFWESQSNQARSRKLICLNPGGAFGAAKHWSIKSFGELAHRLAEERQKTVLVLCGPTERDEARQIVRHANHPFVTSLAGMPPSIGLTKAAIRSAQLLVTTDSGPRHFAQPFNIPVVTLFGPTHIAWSETYYEKATHLQLEVDCGPCQKRVCPLGHLKCMNDLTPAMVFNAVDVRLAKEEDAKISKRKIA